MKKKKISLLDDIADWILNVWFYAKNLNNDHKIRRCLMNVELIEENWQKDKWINSDFLINVLLRNDKFFFDFGSVSSAAKDFIYLVIEKDDLSI